MTYFTGWFWTSQGTSVQSTVVKLDPWAIASIAAVLRRMPLVWDSSTTCTTTEVVPRVACTRKHAPQAIAPR